MAVDTAVNWVRGLLRLNSKYIRDTLKRRNRANKNTPTPRDVFANAPCVFVTSTGRCGTALLTELLKMNPTLDVVHAPEVDFTYPSRLAYQNGASERNCYEIATLNSRYDMVWRSHCNANIFIETNNRITFFAPFLYRLFCGSKFIHLVRHPGSFVRSGLKRGYYTGTYLDEFRIIPRANTPISKDWDNLSQIAKVAWLWNETNSFIEDFKADSNNQTRIITVRSEDLFTQPNVGRQIFEFIGVEPPSSKVISSRISRPVNSQRAGQLAPYSQWPSEEKEQLRKFSPLAEKYGYNV